MIIRIPFEEVGPTSKGESAINKGRTNSREDEWIWWVRKPLDWICGVCYEDDVKVKWFETFIADNEVVPIVGRWRTQKISTRRQYSEASICEDEARLPLFRLRCFSWVGQPASFSPPLVKIECLMSSKLKTWYFLTEKIPIRSVNLKNILQPIVWAGFHKHYPSEIHLQYSHTLLKNRTSFIQWLGTVG